MFYKVKLYLFIYFKIIIKKKQPKKIYYLSKISSGLKQHIIDFGKYV